MSNAGENAAPQRPKAAPQGPNAANNDNAAPNESNAGDNASVEDYEWIEAHIEDNMESLVGSNDDEPMLEHMWIMLRTYVI